MAYYGITQNDIWFENHTTNNNVFKYTILNSDTLIIPEKQETKTYFYNYKLWETVDFLNKQGSIANYYNESIQKTNLIWSVYTTFDITEFNTTENLNIVYKQAGFINGYKETLTIVDIINETSNGITITGLNIGDTIEPNETKEFTLNIYPIYGRKELIGDKGSKITIIFDNNVRISFRLFFTRKISFIPPISYKPNNLKKDQTRFFNKTLNMGEINILYNEVSSYLVNNKNIEFTWGIYAPEIEIVDSKITPENGIYKTNLSFKVLKPKDKTKAPIYLAGQGLITGN